MRFCLGSSRFLCAAVCIQCSRAYPLKGLSAQTSGAFGLWFTERLALRSVGITPLLRYYGEI